MVTEPDTTPAQPAAMRQTPALSAPTLMPRRLFHLHGAINRRKVLAAATSGIAGIILGERLLAPLRTEAQPRGLFPWLSGGGGAATAPSGGGAGGGGSTSATVAGHDPKLPEQNIPFTSSIWRFAVGDRIYLSRAGETRLFCDSMQSSHRWSAVS